MKISEITESSVTSVLDDHVSDKMFTTIIKDLKDTSLGDHKASATLHDVIGMWKGADNVLGSYKNVLDKHDYTFKFD